MAERRDLPVAQEHLGRRRRGAQGLYAQGRRLAIARAHAEAVSRETDRRGQGAGQWQPPVVLREVRDAGRDPRDGRGARPVDRRTRDRSADAIEVHTPSGRARCDLPPIHDHLPPIARPVQQPEPATADPGRIRLHDPERSRHRDGRVEGITALPQHLHTRLGGERMGTRDGRLAGCLRRAGRDRAERQQEDEPDASHAGEPLH